MAAPLAEFIVTLGIDGRIASQGSVSDVLAKDSALAEEIEHEKMIVELDEGDEEIVDQTDDIDAKASKGKLVIAEEVQLGHVSKKSCKYRPSVRFSRLLILR